MFGNPTIIEPLIDKLPVISCLSDVASPNLFEPDEYITDEEIYVVCTSSACKIPPIKRLFVIVTEPVILLLPFTDNPPLIEVGTFITNPLLGEICAIAEPDFNLLISPIESACILNNPLPSPLKIDAVTDPLTFTSAFIVSDEPEGVSIKFVSIIDADNGIPLTIFTEDGEAFITGLPLTKSDITLELT